MVVLSSDRRGTLWKTAQMLCLVVGLKQISSLLHFRINYHVQCHIQGDIKTHAQLGLIAASISDNWISESKLSLVRSVTTCYSSILHIRVRSLLFTHYDKR